MNRKILFAVSLLFVVIYLTSCYKDKFDLEKLSTDLTWNPNIAAPVAHSSLTIRDLLADYDTNEVFIYDQTGFLYLMYHKQVFSVPASDYITIPDQNFTDNFVGNDFTSIGFPASSPKTVTKNYTHTLVIGSPLDAFDSIVFKLGTFTLNVNSTFLHTGTLLITFPTMKKNGMPYSKTVNINTDDGTFNYNYLYNDLNDYTLDLTNPTFNQIPVVLSLTLVKTVGNPVIAAHQADVSVSFSNLKYSIIYGNLGQRPITIQEDTVNIKLFNSTINGQLYFMDPKFRLHITNSFGIPLSVAFNDFRIWSTVTNSYNTFTFPSAYNPLPILAPASPGLSTLKTIQLDTANFPQIRTIVSEFPRYVYLQTIATTNFPTPQYNFIVDTSRFAVDLEVELPMWGRAEWWVLQDTLDFDFSEYYKDSVVDLDNIDWVKIHININNGLPTEAGVQMYFTDTLYNVFDTIFNPSNMEVVASGVLGQSGKVVAPTRKITDVMFTGSRLSHLVGVKKLLIRGYVKTTNAGSTNVRFYEDYALDVKVGVQVQTKIDTGHDFD